LAIRQIVPILESPFTVFFTLPHPPPKTPQTRKDAEENTTACYKLSPSRGSSASDMAWI